MGTVITQCQICGSSFGTGSGPAISFSIQECNNCRSRLNVLSASKEAVQAAHRRENAYDTIKRIVGRLRWR